MNTKVYDVFEFQGKFKVSFPLYVQRVWEETIAVKRGWLLPKKIKNVLRRGNVLKASRVEVVPSETGEFGVWVVYKDLPEGTWGMVTPISDDSTLLQLSQGEFIVRFSDRVIREKLETELGKLPARRGNFVCSSCAINTGEQDFCSACGMPAYFAEGGGGVRYSSETVSEF